MSAFCVVCVIQWSARILSGLLTRHGFLKDTKNTTKYETLLISCPTPYYSANVDLLLVLMIWFFSSVQTSSAQVPCSRNSTDQCTCWVGPDICPYLLGLHWYQHCLGLYLGNPEHIDQDDSEKRQDNHELTPRRRLCWILKYSRIRVSIFGCLVIRNTWKCITK